MTGPGHILLVEDDFAIRETVADVLTGEGFEVACARDGADALRQLGDGSPPPGLILLDLMMPVMDGWSFRSAQREDPRLAAIPVVLVSTGAGAEGTLEALAPDGLLPKPFDLDQLIEVVGRYCPRH